VRQRRSEVAVVLADQLECPAAGLLRQLALARLAASARDQTRGTVRLEGSVQPADLALGKAQQLTSSLWLNVTCSVMPPVWPGTGHF